uniref:Uncharacterized protein n=1 Tax=Rhipicephalus zambeziensis TaxID=60191 RepID=A0A224YHN8_9ACAR
MLLCQYTSYKPSGQHEITACMLGSLVLGRERSLAKNVQVVREHCAYIIIIIQLSILFIRWSSSSSNDATFVRSVMWKCNGRENGKHLLNYLADPLLPFIWCIGRVVHKITCKHGNA